MEVIKSTNILVVSPDTEKRDAIVEQLTGAGAACIEQASTARQALAIIASRPIDLLITGIELGDLDGWRLTRLVRCGALKCVSDLPVIVVTDVWCQRIAEVTAKEYGINRLLPKSRIADISEAVLQCIRGEYTHNRKPRLLVIEDAPDTADLIKRVLERQYQIDIAGNGEKGLALWRRYRHGLILLDYMLPHMSGREILAQITEQNPQQPVVMMTAHSSSELAEEMMLAGATDFLPKPFRAEKLRKVCELAMRREDYLISNKQFAEQVESLQKSEREIRHISETHQQLLHNLQTVVMELDSQLKIRFLNYPWQTLTGYDIGESLGQQLRSFICEEESGSFLRLEKDLQKVLRGESDLLEVELCMFDKNSQKLWAQMKVRRSELNHSASLAACLDNITVRKEAQQQLEYLAMHDSLTGLFNRHYFEESLRHAYADAVRNRRRHGLIYIDLDYFKVINDTFGHQEGDEVLRQISKLMSRRIRATDMLCRLGGDEYAVLVHDITETGLYEIAEDLQTIINDFAYQAKGHRVNLGCSIGLSLIDSSAICAEEYLMQADIALYVAKGRGRNMIHHYDPEDNESEELRSRINWTQKVRQAITDNRVLLHFQPVVNAQTGRVVYFEALVRIVDEQGKLVFPNSFIPALENTGEMHLLDRWIVKLAIEAVNKWESIPRVAINLSAQAFKDDNLVPVIREALSANLVDPEAITFELTESASLFNLNVTKRVINQLNEIGCSFAIDDFGSGFSSFSYLKELPADYIKLDGSFIKNLHRDDIDKALVRSLIQVVQALGKRAVAEFVENEEILSILQEFGVDFVQGFHVGKPLTPDLLDTNLDMVH